MKTNQIIAAVILLIVFSTTSFFAGTKYQQKKTVSRFTQNAGLTRGANGANQPNRGQITGFRQTIGEIISTDDKSITVKMTDGSSKIVLISDSTSINQSTAATKSDLKIGAKVAVMGDQNTDGSITGRTINLNPAIK